MVGVVVGYAVAPVIMARRLSDVPSIPVICAALFLVAIGYLPYAMLHVPTRLGPHEALSVVGLAIVCTAIAFVVFLPLINEIGPARALVITYVNPAVALLLGEHFSLGIALGFPLILVGSALAARRPPAAVVTGAETVAGVSVPDGSARPHPELSERVG